MPAVGHVRTEATQKSNKVLEV